MTRLPSFGSIRLCPRRKQQGEEADAAGPHQPASGSRSGYDDKGRTGLVTAGKISSSALDGLDFEVHARRQRDALVEGVDRLVVGLVDVDQALVRADLKLFA